MVLAEAFMKRNDLKKQISVLTSAASQNLWQNKELPINFDTGTKVNPAEAYKKAHSLMAELQQLNVAIAKANEVNNEILRDLETTTARLAFIEQVLSTAERYPGDKVREPNYGGGESLIVENEWLIDPRAVRIEQEAVQSHKRALEKSLAHNNFVTEVVIK